MTVNYGGAQVPAIENVFWPKGKAPRGKYKVYVEFYENHKGQPGCVNPIRTEVQGQPQISSGVITFQNGAKKTKLLMQEFELSRAGVAQRGVQTPQTRESTDERS